MALLSASQNSTFKMTFSWIAIFGGILLGTAFLLGVAPVMLFTLGKNDSWPEIVGAVALLLSVLPASAAAIYNRLWAGVWLTVVGVYFAVAAAWNAYSINVACGLHLGFAETIGNGFLGWIAIALGLFFWVTGAFRWPNLKTRKKLTRDN